VQDGSFSGSLNVRSDKVLSPTEAAYVAGFMDGEGTLTIGRQKRPENRAGFRYLPIMVVANSHVVGLEAIRSLCGNGRVITCTRSKVLIHKHVYRLQWTAHQIRHLLPQIKPYLLLKHLQADLLEDFLDLIVNGRNTTPEQWAEMERLRVEIRALNHRGRTAAEIAVDVPVIRAAKKSWDKREHDRRGVCSVAYCGRPHQSKGYCRRHYKFYIERGGPKRYERVCEHCQTRFITKFNDTRFCSKSCNDKGLRVRHKNASP
jgi:hypothetical protein